MGKLVDWASPGLGLLCNSIYPLVYTDLESNYSCSVSFQCLFVYTCTSICCQVREREDSIEVVIQACRSGKLGNANQYRDVDKSRCGF